MSLRLPGSWSRLGLGLVLVGVLVATLFLLPRRDEPSATDLPPPAQASGASPSAPVGAAPSEEAFCAGFRTVAAVQGQFLAQPDEVGANLLRDALDDLLATGVPESMGPLARTGYLVEMTGLYATVGEELEASAIPGAAPAAAEGDADDSSLTGAPAAFGDWLTELCPGR